MKKVIVTLVLGTMLLVNSAFAANGENVNEKVRAAFKNEFVQAKDVNWERSGNFIKAVFKMNDKIMSAYFTEEGELMGATRNLLSTELPITLQVSLKKEYADYWITELFEYAKDSESGYYVTLEKADQIITLHSEDGSNWSTFRKIKK